MRRFVLFLVSVLFCVNVFGDECKRGFETADLIVTNSRTTSAVYGDFNEDGLVDVAYSRYSNAQIVALNRGGVFVPSPPINTTFPYNGGSLQEYVLLATADINGDHHLDLIYSSNNEIGVSFGNGHGGFGPMIRSQATPSRRLPIDVNHDGILDVLETDLRNRFQIVVGSSDGTFTEKPLQSFPYQGRLIVGDFDGDGFTDVAVVTQFQANNLLISYAWGSADPGKFIFVDALASVTHADVPMDCDSVDIDRDGAAEIVCAQQDMLQVIRSAKRTPAVVALPLPGLAPSCRSPMLADVNGDGRPDLIFGVSSSYGTTMTVLLAGVAGSFAAPMVFDLAGAYGYTMADVDGDHLPDIAATGGLQGLPSISGAALSRRVGAAREVPGFVSGSTQFYDVNGDGYDDIVAVSSDTGWNVKVLFAEGSGDYRPAPAKLYSPPYIWVAHIVFVGDFDGDGGADLALSSDTGTYVKPLIEFDNQDGVFGPSYATIPVDRFIGVLHRGRGVTPALIARRGNDIGIVSVSSARDVTFTTIAQSPATSAVWIIDTDGDGVEEVLVGSDADQKLHILKGPDAPWHEVGTFAGPNGTGSYRLIAADLNGNGAIDLIPYTERSIYVPRPDGTYKIANTFGSSGSIDGVAVTDFDHDGKPDLLITTIRNYDQPGFLQVLRGLGDGQFERYATAQVQHPFGTPILKDVDRDAWEDVIVSTNFGIEIVRNICGTPRLRAVAMLSDVVEGQRSTLLIQALPTDSDAIGGITIREGGKLVPTETLDYLGSGTFSWTTTPLTAGTHLYDIEYSDYFAGSSHTTITVTAVKPGDRRRAAHH